MSLKKTLEKCFKLIAENRLEEVLLYCDSALEIYHNQPDLISCRAETHLKMENKSKALTDANKAVQLDPQNPYRYSSRAYIKDSLGDLEGAIRDYRKAIEIDPEDAVALNNLGLLEEKSGYNQASKTNFRKADALIKEFGDYSPKATHPEFSMEKPYSSPDYLSTIFKVFSDKGTRKEFLKFVRNGLRLK